MADNNKVVVELGTVIKNRGEWDSLAQNAKLYKDNVVQYNGSAYIVKSAPASGIGKDILPTNTAYYEVFAGVGELADSSDFTNPDATKRAKVPTVGAILDGLNDGIYDVSKRNPTGGPNNDGKFTLEYILSNANTLIPMSWRHGGMVISFVSTSDHKYVQFRYMSSSTAVADFTNVANWQGVDTSPSLNSKNLIESGGIWGYNNTIFEAIGIATTWPEQSNDGDYMLYSNGTLTSTNNRIYKKINGSWVRVDNANPPVFPDKPMIWRVSSSNRFYYKAGTAVTAPYIPLDYYASSLATTIRDGQIKFYNLHAANNGVAFVDKTTARQFWGTNYGYQKPLGTVLFYTLTDGTVVFEQNIDKRDNPGSANYYSDRYYTNVMTGNNPVGIGKYGTNILEGINLTNNPNTVINNSLYTKLYNKSLTFTFNISTSSTFVFCPTVYVNGAGDLEIELYSVSDSTVLYDNHFNVRNAETKIKVVYKIPSISASTELRLTVRTTSVAITNLYIKDDTAYFFLDEYIPSLLEPYDSNDVGDAVDGIGREILCRVENYKHTSNKNTYRTPVGQGGKYYVTLQKTEASNFKIYAVQDNPASTGNVVVSFPDTEDWGTGKTFSFILPKLEDGHQWYISFRNDVADITWQKLVVERAVPKSALSNWANKTIAVYGDSIAAITNGGDDNGPFWRVTSTYDWGQRVAHYFHLKSLYGRGIGSQTYKYRTHGGALCWLDTASGKYVGRLNVYNYDDYLNPETQATVVAAAVEAGYDSQTMTFCRGALSAWDRITKMFPAAIKDSIDAIIVMSVNDDYDDVENQSWEDFAFVENSVVDPEWAASDYYATYGGDYNNTLQGGIASTVMKLQAWMPQARIILCMSGAGDRYNNNVGLVGNEFTKYDSFIKMHRLLSCPLIDIFGTAGINGLNHETYCADQGIHPYTVAGGRAYAAAVIGGMKGILTLKDVY